MDGVGRNQGKKGCPGSFPILLLKRGVRKLEPTKTILWTWKNHKHIDHQKWSWSRLVLLNDMHFSTKLRAVDFCNHLLLAVCRWVWLGPLGPLLSPNTKVFNVMLAHVKNKNGIASHEILVAWYGFCVSGHEKTHVRWGLTCSAKIHQLLQLLCFVCGSNINHHGLDYVNGYVDVFMVASKNLIKGRFRSVINSLFNLGGFVGNAAPNLELSNWR